MIYDFLKNETSVWNSFKNPKKPIILYGMGDCADKVLDAFEKFGIKASGVMASDEFVRGQSFRGFTVKKCSDFEAEFGDFTVGLCFASQLTAVMQTIKSVARKHKTLVPSIPVFGERLFDESFVLENAEKIDLAYSLLADELSKQVYKNILKFYYSGELELLDEITTQKDEAFKSILQLKSNEAYVDLGAYNGDTIDEFLNYCGGEYRKIIAFEPNPKNFKKLQEHCKDLKNAELWQLGAYSENTTLKFNGKAGRSSAISDSGIEVRVAAVDSVLSGLAASYIKADVEGADFQTLLGMKSTLKNFKPKLNFSAYHRFEDIFELPILINRLNPDYKIHLRHHPYIPAWDTNLYCI